MKISRLKRYLAIAAAPLILAACGGGGGGSSGSSPAPAPASAGTAQGLWTGTLSSGYNASILVLPDTSTWGIYSLGGTIYGAYNGTSTGTGSTFSAAINAFDFSTRSSASGSLSGTVNPGVSLAITSSSSGTTGNLIYNNSFDTPATLASVAGNYTGWGISKSTLAQTVTFTISSSGTISSAVPNCSVSGSLAPSSSGKGYYTVSTTYSGSACALGNGVTTTGVAVLDSSSGVNKLIVLTLNGDKSDGYLVLASPSGNPGASATVNAQLALQNWTKSASSSRFNIYQTNGCLGTFSNSKTATTTVGTGYQYSTNSLLTYSNCTPASTSGTEISTTDANYLPVSYLITSGSPAINAYYGVYSSTPNFPVSLTAGASGSIGIENLYTNSNRTTSAGRKVITYTSSAETSTTLLLNLNNATYDANNNLTYTEIDTYRITTAGVATLLSIQVNYSNGTVAYFR